jgi:hypothetical protein
VLEGVSLVEDLDGSWEFGGQVGDSIGRGCEWVFGRADIRGP